MKLNVDFSDLKIATAQLEGIISLADKLMELKVDKSKAVEHLTEFVESNQGSVVGNQFSASGVTIAVTKSRDFEYELKKDACN